LIRHIDLKILLFFWKNAHNTKSPSAKYQKVGSTCVKLACAAKASLRVLRSNVPLTASGRSITSRVPADLLASALFSLNCFCSPLYPHKSTRKSAAVPNPGTA